MSKFAIAAAIEGEDRLQRMSVNARRDLPRLTPQPEREGTVAIVGFGPSLRQTWTDIKTPYVITTSGAHDFLIERGIRPMWHVEFDPRPHKVFFLQHPCQETTYCLASACNPNMFEQLAGNKILLWHGMGGDGIDDADLVIDAEGDNGILLRGGSNAGLRAFIIGHVLGFRRFELFGLDCSYAEDATWAGPHSGLPHGKLTVECNGKKFITSDVMLNAAEELFTFLVAELKNCNVKIFGDHLFAERIKLFYEDRMKSFGHWWKPVDFELERTPIFPDVEEIKEVITEDYRELNRKLHESDADFGNEGAEIIGQVQLLMRMLNTTDVLDYGCGKRRLEQALNRPIKNYDPAITGLETPPRPAKIVVCTQVLEHVEMQCLAAVFADLERVVKQVLFLQIDTFPALKQLEDGRNAHLIVQEPQWWITQISEWFDAVWPPMAYQMGDLKRLSMVVTRKAD